MTPQIFLSLSFVDAAFVTAVRSRLPSGVARYFERSFERGEDLIDAMERGLDQSQVFVLFATRTALAAWPVKYEIEGARLRVAMGRIKRRQAAYGSPTRSNSSSWTTNSPRRPLSVLRLRRDAFRTRCAPLDTKPLTPIVSTSVAAFNVRSAVCSPESVLAATASSRQYGNVG